MPIITHMDINTVSSLVTPRGTQVRYIFITTLVVALTGCGDGTFTSRLQQSGEGDHALERTAPGINAATADSQNPTQSSSDPLPPSPTSAAGQTQGAVETSAGTASSPATNGANSATKAQVPVLDTGEVGPYKVANYIDGLDSSDYLSAVVYYPTDSKRTRLPVSTLSGGFSNTKEDMVWLAWHLASHGFVVIVFTPITNNTLDPNIWATGHKGAISTIKVENGRNGSPLRNKVDLEHLAVSGFSMGGAGTIVAANELGTTIQAAVPICAFNPAQVTTTVPTLFMTGSNDVVANPISVINAYQGKKNGDKALTNFARMSHFDVYSASPQHRNISRYMTAWYQVQLMGDQNYLSYFVGKDVADDVQAGIFDGPTGFRFNK